MQDRPIVPRHRLTSDYSEWGKTMCACENFGLGTWRLSVWGQMTCILALSCIPIYSPSPAVSSQTTLLCLTHCSVSSLHIWLRASMLCFFSHFMMLLSFISALPLPGLSHQPLHQGLVTQPWPWLLFLFPIYSLLSAYIPTESLLSFLCRLWPWLLPVFLPEAPESLGIWEAEWGKTSREKSYSSCTAKGPCVYA